MLSNCHGNDKIEKENGYIRHKNGQIEKIKYTKPKIIYDYNTHTHGVDLGNQIISSIRPNFRYKKWWKLLFYYIFEFIYNIQKIKKCKNLIQIIFGNITQRYWRNNTRTLI